jgi:PDDEXK-like domain of unknown function (DUF3799)
MPAVVDQPRVVAGMPPADYHAAPGLSASGAKLLLPPSCPALYRWQADNGRPPKREFEFGTAAHGQVLGVGEPITVVDADSWRTKDAKAQAAEARAAGRTPVLAAEWQVVLDMAAALRRHPIAGPLLDPGTGRAELSLFWHDDEFGIPRRARLDWIKGRLVGDYKTTDCAAPGECARSMHKFGYGAQGDWYLAAAQACGLVGDDAAFLLIFQEKTPPYLVTVAEPDPVALAAGRDRNRRAMDTYARCMASGVWPGYAVGGGSTDDQIVPLALPRWAEVEHENARFNGDYDTEADAP